MILLNNKGYLLNMRNQSKLLFGVLGLLIMVCVMLSSFKPRTALPPQKNVVYQLAPTDTSQHKYFLSRDLQFYKCHNRTRIGGKTKFKKAAPFPLYRIDG
jgi:hypothetical protein